MRMASSNTPSSSEDASNRPSGSASASPMPDQRVTSPSSRLKLPSVQEMLLGRPAQTNRGAPPPSLQPSFRSGSGSTSSSSDIRNVMTESSNSSSSIQPRIPTSPVVEAEPSSAVQDSHQRRRKTTSTSTEGKPRAVPRRFPCLVPGCGKTLARPSALKTHMRIHSREKPYVCPVSWCSRGFSVYSNMVRHQRLCNHPTPLPGEDPIPPPPSKASQQRSVASRVANLNSAQPLPQASGLPIPHPQGSPPLGKGKEKAAATGSSSEEGEGDDVEMDEEDELEGDENEGEEENEETGEREDEGSVSSSWASTSTSTEVRSPPPSRHSLLALLSDAAALNGPSPSPSAQQ